MPTLYRYSVRTIHGTAKLESELEGLSGEGWEPISFQHDAAGNFEVVLRQNYHEGSNGTGKQFEPAAAAKPTGYAVRSIRTPKIESELTSLSSEGWEAVSFQHELAGAYEVILRRVSNSGAGKTTSHRYGLRSVHGATKLESELADLSLEGWELVRLQRDGAGTYEVILRQEIP